MFTLYTRYRKYLPFLINFFCILLFYSFFLYDEGVWVSSDGLFPMNDTYLNKLFDNSITTWNSSFGFGYSALGFNGTFRIPVYFFFNVIRKLGFSYNLVQYLYFVIISVAGTLGWYFYASSFTKNKLEKLLCYSSLFYVFNFFILTRMHHYFIFQSMMFLPLYLVMVEKWLTKPSFGIKDTLLTAVAIYMIAVSAHIMILAAVITLLTFLYKLSSRVFIFNFDKIKSIIFVVLFILPIFIGTFYYFKNYSNHTQRFDNNYIYQDNSSIFKNFFLMGKNKSLVDNPQGQLILTMMFVSVLFVLKKSQREDRFYLNLYVISLIPSMSHFLFPNVYILFSKIIPFLRVDYNYALFFPVLYFPLVIYIFVKNYKKKIVLFTLILYTSSLFITLLENVNNNSYSANSSYLYNGDLTTGRVMQYPLKFSYNMVRYPNTIPFSNTRYLYDSNFITPSSKEITPDIVYNYAEEFERSLTDGDFISFEYYAKLFRVNYLLLYPLGYSTDIVNYLDENYIKYFDGLYKIYYLKSDYDLVDLNFDAELYEENADTISVNNMGGLADTIELKHYVSYSSDWALIPLNWPYTDSILDWIRVAYISIFENFKVYRPRVNNYYNFWSIERNFLFQNHVSDTDSLLVVYLPGLYYKISIILSILSLFFILTYKKLFNKKR